MKKAILLAAGLAIMHVQAQENMIYYEFLGSGGLSSINYEVALSQKIPLTGRIGVGYISDIVFTNDDAITFPVSLHYLFNLDDKHALELGLGYTFSSYRKEFFFTSKNLPVVLNGGYRYHFADNWMARISFFPVFSEETSIAVTVPGATAIDSRTKVNLWFGLGIGYRF